MKKFLFVFLLLLTIVSTFIFPVGSVHAAIALPEGRTHDQAHDTGYIDWSGSVQYTYFRHRDNVYLPPDEGSVYCGSGCWEWVTYIPNGASVSGSFQRDVTYFEVMLAFEYTGDGVGSAIIRACSATRTVDLRRSNNTTPGFLSIDLSVPAGCRTWSVTATGGYARYRSVDALYVTPTSTPTATATYTPTRTPTATFTLTATSTNVPTSTFTTTATSTSTNVPTSTYTATSTSTNVPTATYTATATSTNTNVPTLTSTGTLQPTSTSTATATATSTGTPHPTSTNTATATATTVPVTEVIRVEVQVPSIIINNTNQNDITVSGSGGSGSSGSGSGSFVAITPLPWGNGGVVLSLDYCGQYNVRVRVYVDYNEDKLMSPTEGVTDLQVFLLDRSYSSLGNTYTRDGHAVFCLSPIQYGRTVYIDIPYLQQMEALQIPNEPTDDLEVWFAGKPPELPLFLP